MARGRRLALLRQAELVGSMFDPEGLDFELFIEIGNFGNIKKTVMPYNPKILQTIAERGMPIG